MSTHAAAYENDYEWDPSKSPIFLNDVRLNRVFHNHPSWCASVNEYAKACGLETSQVVSLLDEYLDSGVVSLEFFGDEVFVNTGPSGRPLSGEVDVPPNLWEQLRARASVEKAYHLWRLLRNLEKSGWSVEHRERKILSGLGNILERPSLAVGAGAILIPVIDHPDVSRLGEDGGVLDQYEHAGARGVAVVCDEGELDRVVTAIRRWGLSRRYLPNLAGLVLEAPRYNPTLVEARDSSVRPVGVTQETLGEYFW